MSISQNLITNKIKRTHFFRKSLQEADNIDIKLEQLINQFPTCGNQLIDMYITVKSKKLGVWTKKQEYPYDNYDKKINQSRKSNAIKSQQDIVERLIETWDYD